MIMMPVTELNMHNKVIHVQQCNLNICAAKFLLFHLLHFKRRLQYIVYILDSI